MSDWHIINGDWPLPLPMGHEGRASLGRSRGDGGHVCDHVIFSFRPHCGRCRYCSSGQTVLCIGRNDGFQIMPAGARARRYRLRLIAGPRRRQRLPPFRFALIEQLDRRAPDPL
jgi:Zn-dependent alcohol dehydrogenase